MALSQVKLQRYQTWCSYLNMGELNKTELSLEESEVTRFGPQGWPPVQVGFRELLRPNPQISEVL